MDTKLVVTICFGIIMALLGLLWFLQGADIIRIRPVLCFADCEPITGKSSQWQIIGAITFLAGILTVGRSLKVIRRRTGRKNLPPK